MPFISDLLNVFKKEPEVILFFRFVLSRSKYDTKWSDFPLNSLSKTSILLIKHCKSSEIMKLVIQLRLENLDMASWLQNTRKHFLAVEMFMTAS